jgi:hypothetical protein
LLLSRRAWLADAGVKKTPISPDKGGTGDQSARWQWATTALVMSEAGAMVLMVAIFYRCRLYTPVRDTARRQVLPRVISD